MKRLFLLLGLAGCVASPEPSVTRVGEPGGVDDGLCYASGIEPKTATTTWFEMPCALQEGDTDFIASIQRALAVRGIYLGDITGVYDDKTRIAVATFQFDMGLESEVLSTTAAKSLGLIALGRAEA